MVPLISASYLWLVEQYGRFILVNTNFSYLYRGARRLQDAANEEAAGAFAKARKGWRC